MPPRRYAVDQNVAFNKPEDTPHANAAGVLPQDIAFIGSKYKCSVCGIFMTSASDVQKHTDGKRHLRTVLYKALHTQRHILIKNKHNIVVRGKNMDTEGKVNLATRKQEQLEYEMVIENKDSEELYILNFDFLRFAKTYRIKGKRPSATMGHICLSEGQTFTVPLTVRANRIGRYCTYIMFHFRRESIDGDIHIIRYMHTQVYDEICKDLEAKEKFEPPPRTALYPKKSDIVEGISPPNLRGDMLKRNIPLKEYTVSSVTRSAVNHGLRLSGKDSAETRRILGAIQQLSFSQYFEHFSCLLQLEELQMEVDIQSYSMQDVTMTRAQHGSLLELQVPGLAENRPSVLRGDRIIVQIKGETDTWYEGRVHVVQLDSVLLGFNPKLLNKYLDGMKFNVMFCFNRLPLKVEHRAVELAVEHGLEKLLFPKSSTICSWGEVSLPSARIIFYDQNIGRNEQQATAVRHIVAGTSRPAPYLIFGPPGTGKTVTMVEAIKQVVKRLPNTHALVCAPSNSAADLLTQRIFKHLDKKDILRMNAASRKWEDIPTDIQELCNYNKSEKDFFFRPKEEICQYKVVVTTLVTAGRLVSANFPSGHFTHVFIDEAGHSLEPESVIAIAGILENDQRICGDGGQIVLAGDPEQLGPVIRSPYAKEYGLGTSLLERLMKSCEPYKRRDPPAPPYDNRIITKLVKNYRSHPAILKMSNDLFYNGELEACADQLIRESFCQWSELPQRNFPLIFHGVIGRDQREGRSPSYFNPEEASVVFQYVKKLMEARGMQKLKETDIGVISPYRQQVVKIRKALRDRNYKEIKVGSVEEFQGQERKVIIISTVRSKPEFLCDDMKFKLGFLANPKKFNVAISRAKALLIIIGNPVMLHLDPAGCWDKMIDYCCENKAYTGVEFEPTDVEDEAEELRRTLRTLHLDGGVTEVGLYSRRTTTNTSAVQEQVHAEWREPQQI